MDFSSLVTTMNQVAVSMRFPIDLDDTLRQITAAVVAACPSIDHASVSVTTRAGGIETLAPTDEVAVSNDALQYELGEGPCLDAALDEPVIRVDDLRTDPRWPRYAPRAAAEYGIGSQLAFQFRAEPQVRGAFNLYSRHPNGITDDDRQTAVLFANLAAAALGWSRRDDQLTEAISTRNTIGQAIGIVMERYRLDPDRAFGFLVRTSQTGNVKLRDVAAGLVADTASRAD